MKDNEKLAYEMFYEEAGEKGIDADNFQDLKRYVDDVFLDSCKGTIAGDPLHWQSVAGAKAPTFFYVPDYFTGGNRPDPVPARKEQK